MTSKQIGILIGGIAVLAIVFALVIPKNVPPQSLTGNALDGLDGTAKKCVIGGCSGELCAEEGGELVSNCIYNPAFVCYKSAKCERQATGSCGWTETPELKACIDNAPNTIMDK